MKFFDKLKLKVFHGIPFCVSETLGALFENDQNFMKSIVKEGEQTNKISDNTFNELIERIKK